MPRPQRSPVLAVGVLSWLAAVAVAWGVSAGTIPVNRWLETQSEPARAKQSPARAPSRSFDTPRIVAAELRPAPTCLLYTSDAAEERSSVGDGGC